MEKIVTPTLVDEFQLVKVGKKIEQKIQFKASDGTFFDDEVHCLLYESSLDRDKLIKDILFKRVETELLEVPYNYYYCDTTDKFDRLIEYLKSNEKIRWYDKNRYKNIDGELIKPIWVGTEYHDGGDSYDYYTITTLDEIQKDYQKLVDGLIVEEGKDGIK